VTGALPVAVVNESFARRYFEGDAMGRRIRLGGRESSRSGAPSSASCRTCTSRAERQRLTAAVYMPFAQATRAS
jgi:hypothetical protein